MVEIVAPLLAYGADLRRGSVATGRSVQSKVLKYNFGGRAVYYKLQPVKRTGDADPIQHVADSKKLQGDAYIDLFEITLSDNVTHLYFKMDNTVYWQGNKWEGTVVKLEGVSKTADDEVSRPKLSLVNPAGVYTSLVDKGLLENANIKRIRVLKEHIDDNVPVFRTEQWKVSRVATVRRDYVVLELRGMLDGQNFMAPGRMFIPPDFPTVSLQ